MGNSDGMRMGSMVFNMLSNMGAQQTNAEHAKVMSEYTSANQAFQARQAEELGRLHQAKPLRSVESPEGVSHWGIHTEDKLEAPMAEAEASVPIPEVTISGNVLDTSVSDLSIEAKARAAEIQGLLKTQDFGYVAQADVMTVKPIVVASGSTVLCFWRQKAGTGQGRKIGPKIYLSPRNSITENDELIKAAYELYMSYGRYA
jgi:hypothetical protein